MTIEKNENLHPGESEKVRPWHETGAGPRTSRAFKDVVTQLALRLGCNPSVADATMWFLVEKYGVAPSSEGARCANCGEARDAHRGMGSQAAVCSSWPHAPYRPVTIDVLLADAVRFHTDEWKNRVALEADVALLRDKLQARREENEALMREVADRKDAATASHEEISALREALTYARVRRGSAFDFDHWDDLCERAMKGERHPTALETEITLHETTRTALAKVREERDALEAEVKRLKAEAHSRGLEREATYEALAAIGVSSTADASPAARIRTLGSMLRDEQARSKALVSEWDAARAKETFSKEEIARLRHRLGEPPCDCFFCAPPHRERNDIERLAAPLHCDPSCETPDGTTWAIEYDAAQLALDRHPEAGGRGPSAASRIAALACNLEAKYVAQVNAEKQYYDEVASVLVNLRKILNPRAETVEQAATRIVKERDAATASNGVRGAIFAVASEPVPMRLHCPACHLLHVDEGEYATEPHKVHACQNCGNLFQPALVPTVGVRFLPGTKNEERKS